MFKDDGVIPNHPRWPLVLYRGAVSFPDKLDPAAIMEDLFDENGWGDSWRNPRISATTYTTIRRIHEVLGIAKGKATVRFGGSNGKDDPAQGRATLRSPCLPAPAINVSPRALISWWWVPIRRRVPTMNARRAKSTIARSRRSPKWDAPARTPFTAPGVPSYPRGSIKLETDALRALLQCERWNNFRIYELYNSSGRP